MSLEHSLEYDVIKEQMKSHCAFSLGVQQMEETMPSYDPLIIRRDQQRIKEALVCDTAFGPMPFAGIRDIRSLLLNAKKGRSLSASELNEEIRLIHGIKGIHAYEQSLEPAHPSIEDLVASLIIHQKTEQKLSSCISEYGEILDSASSQLKEIRRGLKSCDSQINEAVAKFVSSHSSSMIDSIVTYRSGRAVVLVKASEKNTFGGLIYGDSASGQASYVEPSSFVGPNNRKQELLSREQDEMARILQECSREVGTVAEEEIANIETCALLDVLFAKAEWGRQQNACVAELTDQKQLIILKARHPLIDQKKVVANNYHLISPKRTLLITGPNTGGKTVSLKIIGLFTLMTYSGMPVPAESAEIPYFDHVYADIGDDQSVAASLSSFSAHVQKLAKVTQHATGDSLALLDEIGSGTDPREGEALAIAVLNELRERGCVTVATTHYSRLKAYGKRHEDILLASVQFDMEKLAPTYRYMEGLTGQSNALEVAERYGLPKNVIKTARFLKNQSKSEEDELIERLEQQLNETELLKEQLQKQLNEAEEEQKKLKSDRVNLEREKDHWKEHAEKEAAQYVEHARNEADQILKEMREKQETARYHEMLEVAKKINREADLSEETETPVSSAAEFQKGDVVELRASGQAARITSVGRKDFTILLNGRPMHVRAEQIRPSTRIIPVQKPQASVSFERQAMFESVPSECNLIGMHVDEAMEQMDDYMDQVRLHHMKTCRIIHGDGTGRLRKAVQQKLDHDSSVDSWRLGMPSEGGTGATVVVMKD
ncbi:MAG: endonuclease MutS2 [Solobacterium sp.]|jgi:DNA mismatch repair protein MutS2|nr:endonuclease MutS2 [Solobacterium sp.]MCH4222438.1 endonuclease MutS2 [Solobacterium sp.]MCH4265288.1 endonuclease MutS2 [Solobacterium sp.]